MLQLVSIINTLKAYRRIISERQLIFLIHHAICDFLFLPIFIFLCFFLYGVIHEKIVIFRKSRGKVRNLIFFLIYSSERIIQLLGTYFFPTPLYIYHISLFSHLLFRCTRYNRYKILC